MKLSNRILSILSSAFGLTTATRRDENDDDSPDDDKMPPPCMYGPPPGRFERKDLAEA